MEFRRGLDAELGKEFRSTLTLFSTVLKTLPVDRVPQGEAGEVVDARQPTGYRRVHIKTAAERIFLIPTIHGLIARDAMKCSIFLLCMTSSVLAAEYAPINKNAQKVVPVWTGAAPDGWKQTEKEVSIRSGGVTRVANVSQPTLAFYPVKTQNAPAIIVCPGGGYRKLAYDKEGEEIAEWLNTIGVHAFVLKYRLPVEGNIRHVPPLQDAQRAVSLVRSLAGNMKIDGKRIGIMGFSAGGHLAALTSTTTKRTYTAVDNIDKHRCTVDFSVLVYPAYLDPKGTLSDLFTLNKNTPRCFIAHSDDDKRFITGSVIFDKAMKDAGADCTFQHYKTGGHGNGMRKVQLEMDQWPEALAAWLKR